MSLYNFSLTCSLIFSLANGTREDYSSVPPSLLTSDVTPLSITLMNSKALLPHLPKDMNAPGTTWLIVAKLM